MLLSLAHAFPTNVHSPRLCPPPKQQSMPTPFCPSCIPLLHTLLHFPLAQLSLPFPFLHALAIYAHRHRPSRSQRLQPFLVSVTCGVCMFSMDLPLLKARLGLYDLWPSANMEASLIHALSFRAIFFFFFVVATSARCCYRLFDIDYAPPPPPVVQGPVTSPSPIPTGRAEDAPFYGLFAALLSEHYRLPNSQPTSASGDQSAHAQTNVRRSIGWMVNGSCRFTNLSQMLHVSHLASGQVEFFSGVCRRRERPRKSTAR